MAYSNYWNNTGANRVPSSPTKLPTSTIPKPTVPQPTYRPPTAPVMPAPQKNPFIPAPVTKAPSSPRPAIAPPAPTAPAAPMMQYINAMGRGPAMMSSEDYQDPMTYINAMGPGPAMMSSEDYVEPQMTLVNAMGAGPAMEGPAPEPYMAPPAPGTNMPYATMENLMEYFNPYHQALLDQGTRAIESSAASKGRLRSSGTFEEIGDWSNRAGAQAYDAALGTFFKDRGDMYGFFKDGRDFDWNNYRYQNELGYGMYGDEKADWESKLKDFYSQMEGLSSVGANAAGNMSALSTGSATALANLFMAAAQLQGMGGVAKAGQQGNFMSDLIGMIPLIQGLFGNSSGGAK